MIKFNTYVSDFNVIGLAKEEFFDWMQENDDNVETMIQFLKRKANQSNESDLLKIFADELGVSSSTVRNVTRFPSNTYREYYMAICYFLGFDIRETNDFLTRYAKQTALYAKDIAMDAPYIRLISNPKQFKDECQREAYEPIPVWVRRAWAESFVRENYKEIDDYIKSFMSLKKVGRQTWTKVQLAKDIGYSFLDINELIKSRFVNNREVALMIAISLGMTIGETNEFLSRCDGQKPLSLNDKNYYEAIVDMKGFCGKHPRRLLDDGSLEPVNTWIQKSLPKVTIHAVSDNAKNTGIYQDITVNGAPADFRNIIQDSTKSPTSKIKALSIILNWISGTDIDIKTGTSSWLAKNAGNRKYVQQGFKNPYAKFAWDSMRRSLQVDGRAVTRDDFIVLGLLLNMNLDTINEILNAVGFRGIHSNNPQLFEVYLFYIWNEHSEFNYDEYDTGMPVSLFDSASKRPIFDLQLYMSQKIDEYLKTIRERKDDSGSNNKLTRIKKKYKDQLSKPPVWYILPEEQTKRYYLLRKEALKQIIREYSALKKAETKQVEEELKSRKVEYQDCSSEYIDQVIQELAADNNFIISTFAEFIDDCLETWGFEVLREYKPQWKSDNGLLKEIDKHIKSITKNDNLSELDKLIQLVEDKDRDELLNIIEQLY